jgi:hypothetical protein
MEVKRMQEIVASWLHQALGMEPGDELYLEAESRFLQRQLFERYKKGLEKLKELNPEFLHLSLTMKQSKDSRLWIVVTKVQAMPKTGFIKRKDGTIEKTWSYSKAVIRRVSLMLEDNYSKDEIALVEGISLSDMDELVQICCSTQENLKNFPIEEMKEEEDE